MGENLESETLFLIISYKPTIRSDRFRSAIDKHRAAKGFHLRLSATGQLSM
jgi:hypothetical protein